MKPKRVLQSQLLSWLKSQSTGVFAIQFGKHCVTWCANEQVIIDSDPVHPSPIVISDSNLYLLGITYVDYCYQVIQNSVRVSKKKRKFQSVDDTDVQKKKKI
jgi:hypothetical protein